jgi:thymidine kinase
MIPCVKTNKLLDLNLNDELLASNVILINEGQFFNDLYDFIVSMLVQNKKIYVCGLDGDYKRNKFGQMLDIVPLCDKVVKLTSLCGFCKDGTRGIFTNRISLELEQTVVGNDNYIPSCRICYERHQ